MRQFTIKKGGGMDFNPGWHTNVISGAAYGEWNDAKYIDVYFEGYKENFKLRVYEKFGKNEEEFAIANLFRFANAGITDGLDSGADIIVKLNDDANELTGKTINTFYYKDAKGYTAVLNQVAPTTFSNIVDTFAENDVTYYKEKAEKYFNEYLAPKIMEKVEETATSDVPF